MLIVTFDSEREGFISGASKVYGNHEVEVAPKNMIDIGNGDEIQFICDYYDYEGNYQDSYLLGEKMILGKNVEIANTDVGITNCRATYCFTDLYQQNYWTPAID